MKIGRDLPAQEVQPASESRLRLSKETTFDRTMEQMEAAMWRGGKVGAQPANRLPQRRPATVQPLMLQPMAPGNPVRTMAPDTPTSLAAYVAHNPTVSEQTNAPAPTGAVAAAMEPIPGMVPVTIASPLRGVSGAQAALDESPPSRQPVALAVERSHSIDDRSEHRVTWTEGSRGPELVIRQFARDDPRSGLAREALAQIRRHGLLLRRIIVNGVVNDDSHRQGESA